MATEIYLGNPPENIVKWIKAEAERKQQEMLKTPLHFTANEDNSSISLVCYDTEHHDYYTWDICDSFIKLDYSMDGKSWNTYIDPDSEDETLHRGKVINLNKGETVYFKATLGDVEENPNLNGIAYYDENSYYVTKYHRFKMEGSIKANGNIQFLLENTGTKMDVPQYSYLCMFQACTALTQAPKLPATTLNSECYYSMFENCTSLTKAPELPATTLADYCYYYMFFNCSALTQAPELPATNLGGYCYNCYEGMFQYCSSLIQAPSILPATTLNERCYDSMFYGCESLTKAPELPATNLADGCYNCMFGNCTALTQASFPNLEKETVATEVVENQYAFYDAAYDIETTCKDGILIINSSEA